jgi:hypothetical protein
LQGIGLQRISQGVPTANPKQLTDTCESVDNSIDERCWPIDLVRFDRAVLVAPSDIEPQAHGDHFCRRNPKKFQRLSRLPTPRRITPAGRPTNPQVTRSTSSLPIRSRGVIEPFAV